MDPEPVRDCTLRLHNRGASAADTIGTAFLAPILNPVQPESSYALTAWHVVRNAVAAGHRICGTHKSGTTVDCIIVAADKVQDVAIVRLVGTEQWPPLMCSPYPSGGGAVLLCGHPVGFTTFAEEAHGELRGKQQDLEDGQQVIEVVSPEVASSVLPMTDERPGKTPRDFWKGISGGPVVIRPDHTSPLYFAIGIVKRVSPDGVAGRVYCVPIEAAAALCSRSGLCLDLSSTESRESLTPSVLISSIFSNVDDPVREQVAWDQISNLFFARRDVEALLRAVVQMPGSYGLTRAELPFLRYFLARLFLKNGDSSLAFSMFQTALTDSGRMATRTAARLRSLVQARILAEEAHAGPWRRRLQKLEEARRSIEGLSGVPDSYISAELTSLIGLECQGLFSVAHQLPPSAIDVLERLVQDHQALMLQDPLSAPKQAVVHTAMKVLTTLWRSPPTAITAATLRQLAATARTQAAARRNSIFYVQSLLMDAVAAIIDNDQTAVERLVFVGDLLRRSRLSLAHEGIAQLLVFLAQWAPSSAELIDVWTKRPKILSPSQQFTLLTSIGIEPTVAGRSLAASVHWMNEVQKRKAIYECDVKIFVS